jgi:hypothetical protein
MYKYLKSDLALRIRTLGDPAQETANSNGAVKQTAGF